MQDVEEPEIQNRPKLYIYPEISGIGVFEDEEMVEDALLCLCTSEKCYKWKGFDVDISENEENDFIQKVIQDYYSVPMADIITEDPGEESNEFLNYF